MLPELMNNASIRAIAYGKSELSSIAFYVSFRCMPDSTPGCQTTRTNHQLRLSNDSGNSFSGKTGRFSRIPGL